MMTWLRMRAHIGNGSMQRISSVSSYMSGLSNTDRESYFKKLTSSNVIRLPDPCTIVEWIEDVSRWPNIQWRNAYLVEKQLKLRALFHWMLINTLSVVMYRTPNTMTMT